MGEHHSLQDASSLRVWENAEHLLALWTELWGLSLHITFEDNPLSRSAFCLSLCVCDNLVLEKKKKKKILDPLPCARRGSDGAGMVRRLRHAQAAAAAGAVLIAHSASADRPARRQMNSFPGLVLGVYFGRSRDAKTAIQGLENVRFWFWVVVGFFSYYILCFLLRSLRQESVVFQQWAKKR